MSRTYGCCDAFSDGWLASTWGLGLAAWSGITHFDPSDAYAPGLVRVQQIRPTVGETWEQVRLRAVEVFRAEAPGHTEDDVAGILLLVLGLVVYLGAVPLCRECVCGKFEPCACCPSGRKSVYFCRVLRGSHHGDVDFNVSVHVESMLEAGFYREFGEACRCHILPVQTFLGGAEDALTE
eukprot:3035822-Amphidinium_carterae.1